MLTVPVEVTGKEVIMENLSDPDQGTGQIGSLGRLQGRPINGSKTFPACGRRRRGGSRYGQLVWFALSEGMNLSINNNC